MAAAMAPPSYQITNETGIPGQETVDIRATRFFVQFGWDFLRVESAAIRFNEPTGRKARFEEHDEVTGEVSYRVKDEIRTVYRTLPRGRITPCVSWQKPNLLVLIPETALIRGSEYEDPQKKQVYGKEWQWAGDEAAHLIETENGKQRKDGLAEVRALFTPHATLYGPNGSINNLFFPDGFDFFDERTRQWTRRQPQTNGEMIAHLNSRRNWIDTTDEGVIAANRPQLIAIAAELIHAAEQADRIQKLRLEFTHTCRKLAPSDELFKSDYDAVDEEMLIRTGIPRIHDADIRTADAIKMLADQSANGAILKLIESQERQMEMLRQQMDNQNALIQSLLSERAGDSNTPKIPKIKG